MADFRCMCVYLCVYVCVYVCGSVYVYVYVYVCVCMRVIGVFGRAELHKFLLYFVYFVWLV